MTRTEKSQQKTINSGSMSTRQEFVEIPLVEGSTVLRQIYGIISHFHDGDLVRKSKQTIIESFDVKDPRVAKMVKDDFKYNKPILGALRLIYDRYGNTQYTCGPVKARVVDWESFKDLYYKRLKKTIFEEAVSLYLVGTIDKAQVLEYTGADIDNLTKKEERLFKQKECFWREIAKKQFPIIY